MVAKVISGKNIRGIINYNENKVIDGKANCIMANRFGVDAPHLTFSDKLTRFMRLTSLNPKVKTNAIHISLNFDVSEKLTDNKLQEIASVYMEKIGFGSQPYLVYRHHDAAHPHIHIATTNIQSDGKRIDIHNIGREQSEHARKEIEILFGLVRAESKLKNRESILPINIDKVEYGKSETKRSIANVVRAVVRGYKFTSLPELNAVLKQYNVTADTGSDGSMMNKKKGLLYCTINPKGERVGVPIKASSIYGKPTRSFLEKQFKLNEVMRSPFKDRLRKLVDRVLTRATSRAELVQRMSAFHVNTLFRENEQGRVYGVTFIDNKTKVVFNGSDLGKNYSAASILERLENSRQQQIESSERRLQNGNERPTELDIPADQLLDNLLTARQSDFSTPDAAMKRKKKRRKKGRSI